LGAAADRVRDFGGAMLFPEELLMNRQLLKSMIAALVIYGVVAGATAQDLTKFASPASDEAGARSIKKTDQKEAIPAGHQAKGAAPKAGAVDATSASEDAAIESQISAVYQNFYNSYRLGPGDIVSIYIDKHPEDSVEKLTVSPVGRIYFPLLGMVTVVGKTVPQLQEFLTNAVSEYIREPHLTLVLLEAQSAKFGVIGDVKNPGLMVMTRPLRVLDAVTMAGGVLDTGSQQVSVLRQYEDGRVQVLTADIKKILKGKAGPEENLYLRAGDTVIVHGNLFKTITKASALVGVTTLVTFLSRGGR
jgi:protein involved in polysaccharide export with SLBB domain